MLGQSCCPPNSCRLRPSACALRAAAGQVGLRRHWLANRSSRVCPPTPFGLRRTTFAGIGERRLERETGIEPATNSLEGCDSTTELLPLAEPSPGAIRTGGQRRPATPSDTVTTSHVAAARANQAARRSSRPLRQPLLACLAEARTAVSSAFAARRAATADSLRLHSRAKAGGEGRIRTSEATWATDLQSVAFDRSATSPHHEPISSARPVPARFGRAFRRRHRAPGATSMELAKGFEPPTG